MTLMGIENIEKYTSLIIEQTLNRAPKVAGAIVTLIVGIFVIRQISKLVNKALVKTKIDITVARFLSSTITVGLKILLFISVAGMFGIQTTSFVALLGAAGLAVGLSLQGSLENFAGGVLVLLFKPYKVGDFVDVQGIKGHVHAITIFTTTIYTPENKTAIIPNGPIANNTIINHTKLGEIRIDVTTGIAYDASIKDARKVLLEVIDANPYIISDHTGNGVFVSELGDSSVNLIIRGYAQSADYRSAFFQLTEDVKEALDAANIEIPYPHMVLQQK